MSDLPYTMEVLRLAAEAHGAGRLAPPCRTHVESNPVCGDRVTVDVHLSENYIAAFAHDSKACVLTQASASLLGQAVTGHTASQIAALAEAVKTMLQGGPAPGGDFAGYAALADVARHPARHTCVLLPITAILKAASQQPGEPAGERTER